MEWEFAPDIKQRIDRILATEIFGHVSASGITAIRGFGSTSRAIARIWSLPKPWQLALNIKPQYIIEVIAERFDKMSEVDKDKTLIHELMHIPKTFSGALVPHRNNYRRIDRRTVDKMYDQYTSRR